MQHLLKHSLKEDEDLVLLYATSYRTVLGQREIELQLAQVWLMLSIEFVDICVYHHHL